MFAGSLWYDALHKTQRSVRAPVVIKIHYLTTLDKQTKNDAHTKLNFEAIGLWIKKVRKLVSLTSDYSQMLYNLWRINNRVSVYLFRFKE